MQTFYWHDYETWGINPALDRPSQFAGVRTDGELNIIGEPLVLYNKPPLDRLPHPQACLVTGLSPQRALVKGCAEPDFCAQIYAQMSRAKTCNVGYNSLRFDDEVTRFMLFRNFYPVYEREWQQGNSRWDLIDVVRMCYALRPTTFNWPRRSDGSPSFKLEELSAANGFSHTQAHDALSDVYATLDLARAIKTRQPKLFDYAFKLRDKHQVKDLIDLSQRKPLLFVSGFFKAEDACCSLVMPLMMHPLNSNALLAVDLARDVSALLNCDAKQLAEQLYAPQDKRDFELPLMSIPVNRSPMLLPVAMLTDAVNQHINIDKDRCWLHYQQLQDFDRALLELKVKAIYQQQSSLTPHVLPEAQLYQGFINNRDKAHCDDVRNASSQQWELGLSLFDDPRLNALANEYQARHYPQTLDPEHRAKWLERAHHFLTQPPSSTMCSIDDYLATLDTLKADLKTNTATQTTDQNTTQLELIAELRQWPSELKAHLQSLYAHS